MHPVLVIGGTGLLGPTAVREIELTGQQVICLNRSGKHPTGGLAEPMDRRSYDDLLDVFRRYESFDLIDMIPYTAREAATLIEALAAC